MYVPERIANVTIWIPKTHQAQRLTSRNVIQSVRNAVQTLKEVVIVYAFRIRPQTVLVSDDVDVRVHAHHLYGQD